jgi:hypothetical protein
MSFHPSFILSLLLIQFQIQQSLFLAFRNSPEECQIIIKSEALKDAIHGNEISVVTFLSLSRIIMHHRNWRFKCR